MKTISKLSIVMVGAAVMTLSAAVSASQATVDAASYRNEDAAQRIPLTEKLRKASAEALGATLVEIIDQSRAVQQAHWNVRGPLFYPLHDLLGEFYDALNEKVDVIAERKLALGFPADGRPSSIAAQAKLGDISSEMISDKEVLDVLTKRYLTISQRLQERITRTTNDLATQGILIELKTMIDKQLWLLRSFYPTEG